MSSSLSLLLTTAASIGFVHTLIGLDHSLPFVVLGRSRGWSLHKTLGIAAMCGVGHVLSSVLLGTLGIWLGITLTKLTWLESYRGSLAAWSLIGFGLVYAAWSFASQRRHHRHLHVHEDGTVHAHPHRPDDEHQHADVPTSRPSSKGSALTAWSLFLIFVLGPCEPLIPLLLAPAAKLGTMATIWVALTFSLVTIATMLSVVTLGYLGLSLRALPRLENYASTFAGLAIAGSGLAIQFLGL